MSRWISSRPPLVLSSAHSPFHIFPINSLVLQRLRRSSHIGNQIYHMALWDKADFNQSLEIDGKHAFVIHRICQTYNTKMHEYEEGAEGEKAHNQTWPIQVEQSNEMICSCSLRPNVRERSKQYGASRRFSGASKQTNG